MGKDRESNFELLRIFSMFFIVLYHTIMHGKVIENCDYEGIKIVFIIITLLILVHVNSFIITTGYFQSKAKFKQSKLWEIISANWFYKIIILLLFSILGIRVFTSREIIYNLFPLNISSYWFITPYLMLYCFSPFLNKLIHHLKKKEYQKLLLVFFVLFSLIPYFTSDMIFSNDGYTLYSFIMLYFLGGYLREYPLDKSHIFEKCSTKLFRIIMIAIFFMCAVINYSFQEATSRIINLDSILSIFVSGINSMSIMYSNPLIIIQTIAFVSIFNTLKIKSKIINGISALTLGVYLIHDNDYVREYIYKFLKVDRPNIDSYYFILYVIAISMLIFFVCLLIEFFRQLLFKLIRKTKLYIKIKSKYYKNLEEIYITD